MRYFFDLKAGDETLADSEGRLLDTLEAVRRAAVREARAIVSEDAREGHLDLNQAIEVRDEAGHTALVLEFRSAVTLETPHGAPANDG